VEDKAIKKEKIQQSIKDRFKRIINTKLETCFIFALSEMERIFGNKLWGHNLSEDKLTDTQKENREKWKEIRLNILNNGNQQRRSLISELDLHDMIFIGYRIETRRKKCKETEN